MGAGAGRCPIAPWCRPPNPLLTTIVPFATADARFIVRHATDAWCCVAATCGFGERGIGGPGACRARGGGQHGGESELRLPSAEAGPGSGRSHHGQRRGESLRSRVPRGKRTVPRFVRKR